MFDQEKQKEAVAANIQASRIRELRVNKGDLSPQTLNDAASLRDETAIATRENRETRDAEAQRKDAAVHGGALEEFKAAYNGFVEHVIDQLSELHAKYNTLLESHNALVDQMNTPTPPGSTPPEIPVLKPFPPREGSAATVSAQKVEPPTAEPPPESVIPET